jgi:hypothetical protein
MQNPRVPIRLASLRRAAIAACLGLLAAVSARAQAPAAPSLAYPGDGAQNITIYATLKWRKTTGATVYHVQVDTLAAFGAPLFEDSAVADTSSKMARLADSTRYFWRVRAGNATGFGAWSKARSFTTNPTLVTGPAIVSPDFGDAPPVPTLIWNAYPGADTYTVQIALTSNFDSILYAKTDVADTSLQVAGLEPGTLYWWHVRANTTPVYTGWSKGTFTTAGPSAIRAGVTRRGRTREGTGNGYRADGRALGDRARLPGPARIIVP